MAKELWKLSKTSALQILCTVGFLCFNVFCFNSNIKRQQIFKNYQNKHLLEPAHFSRKPSLRIRAFGIDYVAILNEFETVKSPDSKIKKPSFLKNDAASRFFLSYFFPPLVSLLVLFGNNRLQVANAAIQSPNQEIGLMSRIIKRKVIKRQKKVRMEAHKSASGLREAPKAEVHKSVAGPGETLQTISPTKVSKPKNKEVSQIVGAVAIVMSTGAYAIITAKKKAEKAEKTKLLKEKMMKTAPVKKKKTSAKNSLKTSVPKSIPEKVYTPPAPNTSIEVEDATSDSVIDILEKLEQSQPAESPATDFSRIEPPTPPQPEIKIEPAQMSKSEPAKTTQAPVEEKKPAFNLFKKKNEKARPNNLADALLIAGPTEEFRIISSQILSKMAPETAFPDIKGGETDSREEAIEKLLEAKAEAQLTDNTAAEEFACIVNAMIVQLVDDASETLKGDDLSSVTALDAVINFMDSCSSVFEAIAENPTIKPVRYNGETAKGKLENLYARYAFHYMGKPSEDADKLGRLDRLQDLFNIPNSKAEKVSQQVMTKLMQKVAAGEMDLKDLGFGDSEGVMEALKGLTAGGLGGGGGGLPGVGGGFGGEGFPGGFPNIDGMPPIDPKLTDPKMIQQTIDTLREMTASGVNPQEVAELRKMFKGMGMDLDQLVEMSDALGSELGPEGKELFSLMKKILGK